MIKKTFAILLLLVGIGSISSVCATEPTNYPYYIEDMGNGQYNIWTKVNVCANSNKTIYIKKVEGYGPNGDDVFEFFDDFEGDSLDMNKWVTSAGSITVSDSELSLNSYTDVYASYTLHSTIAVDVKINDVPPSYNYAGFGISNDIGEPYLADSGDRGFTIFYNEFDDEWIFDSRDNSNIRTGQQTSYPSRSGKFILRYDGTTAYFDGNAGSWSNTLNIDITPLKLYFSTENEHLNVDYIFVRKYANQEPTGSVEQVDGNTWKITIHNPNNADLNDYQVKIDGNGIVSSKTDSLLFTENIPPQYLTLTAPDIWNINTPVNATVSGYNISQGTTVYLDWGDGQIDNQIYNGEDLEFQHTYSETGTYTIKAYVNTSITTEKQIIITENLTTGILAFKPLYENTTITGWAIVNGMNVSMAKTATIYGILGKPVKIQTDKGYMTSILFSTNMTAYVAGNEYQYVTVSLSADNPITVKNGDKIVGYGKNVYITQPVGDTITVWCNNKKIREYILRSSIDDYIYIPKQHITANIRENNGILAVYLETWRKEKLHINIQKEDTTIYETEGYYEGFQRIDTGITPEAGNTYKLTILNEDGNIVSYSTYTYSPETEKPDIPEQEGYIWIAFLMGVVIMVMGVIRDNLPIALLGVGLFVLLVPYNIPYLDHLAAISTALAIIIIISRHIKRNAGD